MPAPRAIGVAVPMTGGGDGDGAMPRAMPMDSRENGVSTAVNERRTSNLPRGARRRNYQRRNNSNSRVARAVGQHPQGIDFLIFSLGFTALVRLYCMVMYFVRTRKGVLLIPSILIMQ